MLEKEAQQKFLLALYLLFKENPGAQIYHDDVAKRAGLAEDIVRVKTSILPDLQSKGLITMMGMQSRIPLTLTKDGLEKAENLYEARKDNQDNEDE